MNHFSSKSILSRMDINDDCETFILLEEYGTDSRPWHREYLQYARYASLEQQFLYLASWKMRIRLIKDSHKIVTCVIHYL